MAEEEKTEKEEIKVAESKDSKESRKKPFEVVDMLGHPGRYEIVDTETGEVVDNANGYGYKSKPNAYRAAWYKFGGGKAKVSSAESWWKKHENLQLAAGKMPPFRVAYESRRKNIKKVLAFLKPINYIRNCQAERH